MNRITLPGMYGRISSSVAKTQARLADAYGEVSSGKAINRPSDDPIGTLQVMHLRQDSARQKVYARGAEDARQILDALDISLQDATDIVNSAVERMVQAAGGARLDAAAREAIAVDIEALRDELLSVANRTHANRPLFSGTTTPNPTFDSSGNYLGNSSPLLRDIAEGETIQATIPGDQVFGTGPTSLIASLTDAATAVRNNDEAGRQTSLATLRNSMSGLEVAITQVGARQRRVDQALSSSELRQLRNTNDISMIEDVDFEEAVIKLKALETTYQATLAAAGRVSQYTLLDFLR